MHDVWEEGYTFSLSFLLFDSFLEFFLFPFSFVVMVVGFFFVSYIRVSVFVSLVYSLMFSFFCHFMFLDGFG